MFSDNLRNLQNGQARLGAPSTRGFRKLQMPAICLLALALQACAGLSPNAVSVGVAEGAQTAPALARHAEAEPSSSRPDLLAQARALVAGERVAHKNDQMIAALTARKSKSATELMPELSRFALTPNARPVPAEGERLSREEMLARLRKLAEEARTCATRQECARMSLSPSPAPELGQTEARLQPDDVMRRLRELAAPAHRVASVDVSAFGTLPSDLPIPSPSNSISADQLRAIEGGRHAQVK